jgi:hypothetical protein
VPPIACRYPDRVAPGSMWGMTPRESIARECSRRGRDAFVQGCIDLVEGGEADPRLIAALGGPPARWAITGERPGPEYWRRVWAARGLLWEWDEAAVPAVLDALEDPAWRVREMALRVVARHRLGQAFDRVTELQQDPVRRVRDAATRARVRLVQSGQ